MTTAIQKQENLASISTLKRGSPRTFNRLKKIASVVPTKTYDFDVLPEKQRVEVKAWTDHFAELSKTHRLYFVTTTYASPPGAMLTPNQAAANLKRFYSLLLQYAVHQHNHSRSKYRHLQPAMYSFLDAAASKRKSTNLVPGKPKFANDDLHHHSILVVKPEIAEKHEALCHHPFLGRQLCKRSSGAHIKSFRISPIYADPDSIATVVDYATFHSRKRHGKIGDAFDVFPISESERLKKAA